MGATLTIKIRDYEDGMDMDFAEAVRRLRSGETIAAVPAGRHGRPVLSAVVVYPPGRKYGKPSPAEISWSSPVAQPPDLALLFAGTVKLAAEIANAASA